MKQVLNRFTLASLLMLTAACDSGGGGSASSPDGQAAFDTAGPVLKDLPNETDCPDEHICVQDNFNGTYTILLSGGSDETTTGENLRLRMFCSSAQNIATLAAAATNGKELSAEVINGPDYDIAILLVPLIPLDEDPCWGMNGSFMNAFLIDEAGNATPYGTKLIY